MDIEDNLKSQFEKNKSKNQIVGEDAHLGKAIDILLDEAKQFQESAHVTRGRLLKFAFGLAGVLALVAISEAIALAVMMPLKQIQPVLVKTYPDGYAEVVRDFSDSLTFDKEVDEYFLKEYVGIRESYDWHKMQYIADYTKAWSSDNVFNEFYNFVTSDQAPLKILGEKARIATKVTSIIVNKDAGTAVVRLTKTPQLADGGVLDGVPPTYWVVELKYQMQHKQKHKDREYNPFGYLVPSYTLIQDKTK